MTDNPFMSAPLEGQDSPLSTPTIPQSANPFMSAPKEGGGRITSRRTSAIIVAVAFGGAVYGVIAYYQYREADDAAWRSASSNGSASSLTGYLSSYPSGRHVADAKKALDALDDAAWRSASSNGSASSLAGYLSSYPSGRPVADAKKALDALDDAAWRSASSGEGYEPIKRYLVSYSSGRHSSEARIALEKKIACTRSYAEGELREVLSLAKGTGTGARDIYTTQQGAPYSTTYFSDGNAITYYHSGAYATQTSIELKYSIENKSRYLLYRKISGEISYRTSSGSILGAVLGAIAGMGACNLKGNVDSLGEMAACGVGGGALGYAAAGNTVRLEKEISLSPGGTYSGSAYVDSGSRVSDSAFELGNIKAEIYESAIMGRSAPGC